MSFWRRTTLPDKLNICLVTRKFPYPGRGDDENYLWPLAQGLARRGHDVTVLSWLNPRGRPEIISDHVRAYFLGENKRSPHRNFPDMVWHKFEELHTAKPFHIVHSLDEAALMIGKNRKKYGVAVTYDVSATQMAQIFSILGMAQDTLGSLLSTGVALAYKFLTTYLGSDRAILKTADGVFVATPLQRIMLERYYMYPELKTFIVPYNMDHLETELKPRDEDLRMFLNLPAGGQNIVTFSDMTEFEEVAHLLRAFQKVVIKKPNSRLIIIGNGPLRKQLEFEMLNLALGSKVVMVGSIPASDLTRYISLADLYVNLSSRTSGFETAMLEAMVQKKVVIGSELSPIATIIEDGQDGFLVRPADVASLTDLIASLFSGQYSQVEEGLSRSFTEIGERARTKVLNLFDVDKMVDQTLTAYVSVLKNANRRPKPHQALSLKPA
jgi:glycosyltransferase involved in cell wall biosynthesis